MRFVQRAAHALVLEAARGFPAVVVTGPRRAGKTTLLRHLFPGATYVLLEDPDLQSRARSDPKALIEELRLPAVFDEIQNVPELFAYIRTQIDRAPRRMGKWLFTGSQEAPLMQGVSESMAGRAAVLQLLAFSLSETQRVSLLHGGYPEVVARPAGRQMWFSSYIQTYLERDVRGITNIRDLATFRRFLAILASRHGQILNRTDLAAPLGVSVPTVSDWLHVLEITGQVILVPPYFENFGKRLIKSPKVYIGDSGLACYLLGITTQAELERSPFLGALFEGWVAAEILKSQINQGRRKELYHFRDQQGLEVDFLFPNAGGVWAVECKASKTVHPGMAGPLKSLRRSMGDKLTVRSSVVHRASKIAAPTRAVSPGVEALDVETFVSELNQRPRKAGTKKGKLHKK
jgi:predicted AAA+ superfamily ATPase